MGCVVFKGQCKCITQQGTTHHATMQFCLATIENGIFQDFDIAGKSSGRDSSNQNSSGQPIQAQNQASTSQSRLLTPVQKSETLIAHPELNDVGFNLPVTSAIERYKAGFTSHPSGLISYSNAPTTAAMFGGK